MSFRKTILLLSVLHACMLVYAERIRSQLTAGSLCRAIEALGSSGVAILMATHDLFRAKESKSRSLLRQCSTHIDRISIMYGQKINELKNLNI